MTMTHSPRSQSASTVARDSSDLLMISGYSISDGGSYASLQRVGLEGAHQEELFSTVGRMASAVTLSTGEVLLTGGKGVEQVVFLLDGPDLSKWVPKQHLQEGRQGHSSIATILGPGSGEKVIVAGGWSEKGETLKSVELYNLRQNRWQFINHLPSPRADFTLQARGN